MTELLRHFEDFVRSQNGKIVDYSQDKKDRFICSIFPIGSSLQPGDVLTGGLAVRVEDESLQLHAYFLRQICTNGMVRALQTQAATFTVGQLYEFQAYLPTCIEQFREVDFRGNVEQLRFSLFQEVDESKLRRIAYQVASPPANKNSPPQLFPLVGEEMTRPQPTPRPIRGPHPRLFDVVNGVTALARDTADPAVRWELMRLGGELLNSATPSGPAEKPQYYRKEAATQPA